MYNKDTTVVGFLANNGTFSPNVTTWNTSDYIKIVGGESYNFNFEPVVTGTYWQTRAVYYDKNKQWISGADLSTYPQNYTQTFTAPSGAYYVRMSFTNTNTYERKDIQVNTGSTATSYEPYQSQSYPINLGSLELAKISTYKDKLNRSIGKNQFGGVMESGGISGITGQDEDLANRIRSKNKIPIDGKTLTISCSQTNKKLHVYFYEADQTFIGHTDAWKDFPYTFTVASNVKYVRLLVKNSNDSSIQPTDITNIQIEKGSSATSPEPYGKGKWYKYENIGKKVLNGSETINSISNNRFQIALSPSAGDGYSTLIEVCNIFRPITQLEISSTSKEYVVAVNSGYIYIRATSSTTEAQLRTILSNTNANVYYIKAIPTITEITDTTLIGQLEAIHLATGTNVIDFNGDTLVSGMDVNYIAEANPHL